MRHLPLAEGFGAGATARADVTGVTAAGEPERAVGCNSGSEAGDGAISTSVFCFGAIAGGCQVRNDA